MLLVSEVLTQIDHVQENIEILVDVLEGRLLEGYPEIRSPGDYRRAVQKLLRASVDLHLFAFGLALDKKKDGWQKEKRLD